MVISSLVVNTLSGETQDAADALNAMEGVEVHEIVDYKLVVTIESETVDSSAEIANSFMQIPSVINCNLIYVNFEDDPSLNR